MSTHQHSKQCPVTALPSFTAESMTLLTWQHALKKEGWPPHAFDEPVQVLPNIWVSGVGFSNNVPKWCHDHGFTHLINTAGPFARECAYIDNPNELALTYYELDLDDKDDFSLQPAIENCYAFLYHAYQAVPAPKILVHCMWGQSRSVSCLVYFAMMYWSLNYDQALEKIREHRPIAQPNYGFERQLRASEVMILK